MFAAMAAPLHAASPYETVLQLIQSGRFDDARAFAGQIAGDERLRSRNLALVEALILKRTGRLEQAAGLLGELLDADPASSRVRQELAHTLFLTGDDDRARYHFEFLKETMDSAALSAVYDRFLAAIRERRPWTLDGSVGFAPSTNINDGTPGSTVYIAGVPFTNENAAQSGVGLSYGLSGSYRFKLTDRFDWIVGGSLGGASYTQSNFDRMRLGVHSELSSETRDWRLAGGIAAERMLSGWKGYSSGLGPYLFMRHSLGGGATVEARLSHLWRRHDVLSAYDGTETNFSLSYRRMLSPRLSMTLGSSAGLVRTQRDFTSFVATRPRVSADYLLNKDLIVHASAGYENRSYRGNFPLTGQPRRDHRFTLGMGATLRGLTYAGFVPRISYEYLRATSNVELFERNNHSLGLSISKRY